MIRLATINDVALVADLGARFHAASGIALPFSRDYCAAFVRALIFRPEGAVWLWGNDGFLAASLGPHPFSPVALATEHAMWVEPPARRGRAASHLMAAFEAWARERGAWGCVMTGMDDRVASLYARRGYERQAEAHWLRQL